MGQFEMLGGSFLIQRVFQKFSKEVREWC